MNNVPPNITDLPADVQAFVAGQLAELARKDADILGLTLPMLQNKSVSNQRWMQNAQPMRKQSKIGM